MIPQLDPKDAAEILKRSPDAVYLDVRTVEEFEAGHAAGAWNVPVVFFDANHRPVPNPEFESVIAAVLQKDRKIVVGCQSGVRSQRAAEIMKGLGFTDVANLTGGFGGARDGSAPGWRQCGLPVESGASPGVGYEELRKKA